MSGRLGDVELELPAAPTEPEEKPGCERCGDRGVIQYERDGTTFGAPCPECRANAVRSSVRTRAGVPPRWAEVQREDLEVAWPSQFTLSEPPYFELVAGGGEYGVAQAVATCRFLDLCVELRAPGRWCDVGQACAEESARMRYQDQRFASSQPLVEAPLLLLCDIEGAATQYAESVLCAILRNRWQANRHTIVCTSIAETINGLQQPTMALLEGFELIELAAPQPT